jgi:hypothetical protein
MWKNLLENYTVDGTTRYTFDWLFDPLEAAEK